MNVDKQQGKESKADNEPDIQDVRWSYCRSERTLEFAKYHQYISIIIFYVSGIIELSLLMDYGLLEKDGLIWIPYLRMILFGPLLFLLSIGFTLYMPYIKSHRKWRWLLPYISNVFYYVFGLHFIIRNEIFLRSEHSHVMSAPRLRFFTYDIYLWIGIYSTFQLSLHSIVRKIVCLWLAYAVYLYTTFPRIAG